MKDGSIEVGLLFTGSSVIDPDFVLLTDDKGLQPADNAIAVWQDEVDSPALGGVIDAVNAKLDTAAYNEMSGEDLQRQGRRGDVAKNWLSDNGLT